MIRTAARFAALALLGVATVSMIGCSTTTETATSAPEEIGFLSTYRHLEPTSPATLSYLDPNNRLARYDKFVIMPVEVRMYSHSDLTADDVQELQKYMHDTLARALSQRYQVVTTPSFDAARIRIAVTNVQKSTPILNVIPRPKLLDIGLGAMSLEAEVLDSQSQVQIAATIESRTGQNRWIDFTQLDDAKAVMDVWADNFAHLLDVAHGYATE